MEKNLLILCIISIAVALNPSVVLGAEGGSKELPPVKKMTNSAGLPIRSKMNINRISSWYDSDGIEEINSRTGNSGLNYPSGTATAIFTAGLMFSGNFNDGRTPVLRATAQVLVAVAYLESGQVFGRIPTLQTFVFGESGGIMQLRILGGTLRRLMK